MQKIKIDSGGVMVVGSAADLVLGFGAGGFGEGLGSDGEEWVTGILCTVSPSSYVLR